MEKKPSTQSVCSTNASVRLPDLGTLWMHDRFGLVMYLGAQRLGDYIGSSLYTVHVLIMQTQHRTEGIFSAIDWHDQFTPV